MAAFGPVGMLLAPQAWGEVAVAVGPSSQAVVEAVGESFLAAEELHQWIQVCTFCQKFSERL